MHQPFDDKVEFGQLSFRNVVLSITLLKIFLNTLNILVDPSKFRSLHKIPPQLKAKGALRRLVCCYKEELFSTVQAFLRNKVWPPVLGIFCTPSHCLLAFEQALLSWKKAGCKTDRTF
jgi:hypothetical protein